VYRTYDWTDKQVLVTEYRGEYSAAPGDTSVRADLDENEKVKEYLYDHNGIFDISGTGWTFISDSDFNVEYRYITDTFVRKELLTVQGSDPAGTIYTYNVIGEDWYENSRVMPYDPEEEDPFTNGSFTEYHYDDSTPPVFTGITVYSYDRSTIWSLDADYDLIKTISPNPVFAKGVNLPWVNYGYDIGRATLGDQADQHMGYSSTSTYNAMVTRIKERQGDYIRIFLLMEQV